MAWFKVDDGFYSHTKVLLIPRSARAEALGTWTLCGTWSADKLKDGYVPAFMVEELGGSIAGADALVAVKLWRKKGDGYLFVNWTEFQPSREKVLERRNRETERKAEWRARKPHDSGGVSANVPTGQMNVPHTPSRPVPSPTSNEVDTPRKRGTRIPEPFIVTGAMRQWASTNAPGADVDRATTKFVNHWRSQSVRATKLDWVATWENWLMNDSDRSASKPTPEARARRTMTLATDLLDQKAIDA